MAATECRRSQRAQRPADARPGRESRTPRPPGRAGARSRASRARRAVEARGIAVAVGHHPGAHGALHGRGGAAAAARAAGRARARRRSHGQGHPPAAAGGQPGQHADGALGHVGLEPLGGAERHRRGHVQHDPRGHECARARRAARAARPCARWRMRRAGARRRRAGRRAGRELGARRPPRRRGARPGAGPPARRAKREVQRLHEARGDRPRPLAGRGRRQRRGRRRHWLATTPLQATISSVVGRGRARVGGCGSTASSTCSSSCVRRHAVAERLVAEHEPVAQHVGREVAHVGEHGVGAPAQQRQRPGRLTRPIGPRGLTPYST